MDPCSCRGFRTPLALFLDLFGGLDVVQYGLALQLTALVRANGRSPALWFAEVILPSWHGPSGLQDYSSCSADRTAPLSSFCVREVDYRRDFLQWFDQ